MVFSSLTFLFLFLPAMLLVYYASPRQGKNAVLFLGSLIFYAWGEPVYVVLMIFSTVLDYTCGRLVERYRGTPKQKLGLIISLCGNLGLLFFFKYADFLTGTINHLAGLSLPKHGLPLPIGISFYTFQTMSYTIDVYRGTAKVQRNIISFGAYVALFPQLIAGPIVRYRDIAEELDTRTHSFDSFGEGARRFVTGLAKKVLLANNIGLLWDAVSQTDVATLTTAGAWLGLIALAFQVYFDFSGYSDMAIGLGRMLGFSFPENFNYPYIAASVTEFWRRWHISLGTWFRDYVYIPLGGNRRGLAVQLRNIVIVWLLTGFWHGASWNYVLWGLWYALILLSEKLFLSRLLKKLPRIIGHVYTLFVVVFAGALFGFEDIRRGFSFIRVLFGGGAGLINDATRYQFLSFAPLLAVCAVASTPLVAWICRKIFPAEKPAAQTAELPATVTVRHRFRECLLTVCDSVRVLGLSALSLAYLISGSYNPFLYFRF
ncbi:MAG: MBOAT family protein [Lachnospiraceae bacterium]|nr:MBOAT family protein [Lachnospiraceae bacterium]